MLLAYPAAVNAAFDFTMGVSPDSATITQGESTTATVTVTKIGDPAVTVTLTKSVTPPTSSVTVTLNPTSGTPEPSFTSTMTATTTASTPAGTYTIIIEGTGGGMTHSAEFRLVVNPNDYTVSLSSTSGAVLPGGSTTTSVFVVGGLRETVSLSCPGVAAGVTCNFVPASGTPTFTSTLTLTASNTIQPGSYPVTVRGTSQSTNVIRDVTFTLMIPAILITPVINTGPTSTTLTVKVSVTGFPSFNGYDIRILYKHTSVGGPLDANTPTTICLTSGTSTGPPCVFPAGAQMSTLIRRADNPIGEVRVFQQSTLATNAPTTGDLFQATFLIAATGLSQLDLTLDSAFLGETSLAHVTTDGYYFDSANLRTVFEIDWSDYDNNGIVDINDVAQAAIVFDLPSAYWDLDVNGVTDINDIAIVAINFDVAFSSLGLTSYPGTGYAQGKMDFGWKAVCSSLPEPHRTYCNIRI